LPEHEEGSGSVQEGRVEAIYISASTRKLPRSVARVRAVQGKGLEGDRYFSGIGTWSDYPVETGRDLTLVEAEVLEEIGLPVADARRNVVTRGVALETLIGKHFRVGEIECYGDRVCEPCAHLESLTRPGVLKALHLRADITRSGEIAVGDTVLSARALR
jgi:hypothetical protein